jgi:sugar lactone lactonase YvrE
MQTSVVTLFILAALACASLAPRAQPSQQSGAVSCSPWLACMNESVRAAQAGEFARFHDLAWRAVQTGPPRHAPLLYLLARAQALSGRPGDAIVLLERLARMGVPTNASTEAHFASTRRHARWPDVEARLAAAREPRSAGDIAFRLGEPDLVPESLAYDAVNRRFLVGSLYRRKIVQVDEATGRMADFMTADAGRFYGVAGVKIDAARQTLWVCSAALPEMEGFTDAQRGRSRLHRIDLRSGELVATLDPPGDAHLLNDLAISPQGDVYVTDSEAGVVHRVRPGGTALEPFVTIGEGHYPNGIAIRDEGTALYVASFAGITHVDVATRAATLVQPAGDIALSGIDGLYLHRGALLAVQSLPGISRVVRLALDGSGRSVTGWEALESNLPEFDWPTTGVIVGEAFYYIANAQLRSFEAPGMIWPSDKLKAPVVRRLPLR